MFTLIYHHSNIQAILCHLFWGDCFKLKKTTTCSFKKQKFVKKWLLFKNFFVIDYLVWLGFFHFFLFGLRIFPVGPITFLVGLVYLCLIGYGQSVGIEVGLLIGPNFVGICCVGISIRGISYRVGSTRVNLGGWIVRSL